MDAHHFDALSRTLSASGTRRALSSLLPMGLGLLASGVALSPDVAAKKSKKKKRKEVGPEGPCGDGGGNANRCRKNRHCCTGYCQRRKKQRKNGKRGKVLGRCRCRREGQSCTEDRNCCVEQTGRICQEGTCQIPLCAELCPDGCCDGETCLAGNSDDACGTGGAPCQTCEPEALCFEGGCACGDVCAAGCPFSSIQDAIAAATAGDTIRLCAETYAGTLTINKNVTLLGVGDGEDGTVLDGQGQGTVVNVIDGVTATLEGLRITGGDGQFSGDGGGVFNGGTLTLTGCTVTNNEAADDGGGLNNIGTLTLTDCTVTNNVAGDDGGGINNNRLAAGGSSGTATLTNCTVTNNVAGSAGGGIANFSTITCAGCTVSGNSADRGGGIDNGLVNAIANLTDSTVTGNEANEGGGISAVLGSTVNLNGTTSISGNDPDNCAGDGTYNGSGCAPNP